MTRTWQQIDPTPVSDLPDSVMIPGTRLRTAGGAVLLVGDVLVGCRDVQSSREPVVAFYRPDKFVELALAAAERTAILGQPELSPADARRLAELDSQLAYNFGWDPYDRAAWEAVRQFATTVRERDERVRALWGTACEGIDASVRSAEPGSPVHGALAFVQVLGYLMSGYPDDAGIAARNYLDGELDDDARRTIEELIA